MGCPLMRLRLQRHWDHWAVLLILFPHLELRVKVFAVPLTVKTQDVGRALAEDTAGKSEVIVVVAISLFRLVVGRSSLLRYEWTVD